MKFAVLTVAAMLAAATAAPLTEDQYQFLFTKFSQQYNKQYATAEIMARYNTFKANLDLIVSHNAQGLSYKMGINQFTDMTKDEFSKMMGFSPIHAAMPNSTAAAECAPEDECEGDDCAFDWSATDKVAPIQNQGQCGSCWAFSSIAGLESAIAIKNNAPVVKLSEQQAVDCSTSNSACSGGLMEKFYDDVIAGKFKNGGVCKTEEYLPYSAKKNSCQTDMCTGVATVKDYCRMPISKDNSKDDIWKNQLKQGPITIGVAASSSAFQMYKEGVVTNCTDQSHNHAVVLVGFDAKDNAWVVRNSWGSTWGLEGHIKLSVNGPAAGKAQCGITVSGRDIVPNPE